MAIASALLIQTSFLCGLPRHDLAKPILLKNRTKGNNTDTKMKANQYICSGLSVYRFGTRSLGIQKGEITNILDYLKSKFRFQFCPQVTYFEFNATLNFTNFINPCFNNSSYVNNSNSVNTRKCKENKIIRMMRSAQGRMHPGSAYARSCSLFKPRNLSLTRASEVCVYNAIDFQQTLVKQRLKIVHEFIHVMHLFQGEHLDIKDDDYREAEEGLASFLTFVIYNNIYNYSIKKEFLDYMVMSLKMTQDNNFKQKMLEAEDDDNFFPVEYVLNLLPALLYYLELSNLYADLNISSWKSAKQHSEWVSMNQLHSLLRQVNALN